MKIHIKREGQGDDPRALSICGRRGTPFSDEFGEATCIKCLASAPRPEPTVAQSINTLTKMAEQIIRNKIIMENTLRKNLGLPPRCKNCRQDVRMMVMEGTGFCSMNCKETYEHLHKEKT